MRMLATSSFAVVVSLAALTSGAAGCSSSSAGGGATPTVTADQAASDAAGYRIHEATEAEKALGGERQPGEEG